MSENVTTPSWFHSVGDEHERGPADDRRRGPRQPAGRVEPQHLHDDPDDGRASTRCPRSTRGLRGRARRPRRACTWRRCQPGSSSGRAGAVASRADGLQWPRWEHAARGVHRGEADGVDERRPARGAAVAHRPRAEAEHREHEGGDLVRHAPRRGLTASTLLSAASVGATPPVCTRRRDRLVPGRARAVRRPAPRAGLGRES